MTKRVESLWILIGFASSITPIQRMEQRNGRIDRKLQPRDIVRCHYFYYQQRPEDRILKVLVRKTQTIREELGSLSQVIDARLATTMKGGSRVLRGGSFNNNAANVRSSNRNNNQPDNQNNNAGFRVASTLLQARRLHSQNLHASTM